MILFLLFLNNLENILSLYIDNINCTEKLDNNEYLIGNNCTKYISNNTTPIIVGASLLFLIIFIFSIVEIYRQRKCCN